MAEHITNGEIQAGYMKLFVAIEVPSNIFKKGDEVIVKVQNAEPEDVRSMKYKDKEVYRLPERNIKVTWERDYLERGTCTERNIEGDYSKKDVLDSIVSIMDMGKVNLVDLLLHLSPKTP